MTYMDGYKHNHNDKKDNHVEKVLVWLGERKERRERRY